MEEVFSLIEDKKELISSGDYMKLMMIFKKAHEEVKDYNIIPSGCVCKRDDDFCLSGLKFCKNFGKFCSDYQIIATCLGSSAPPSERIYTNLEFFKKASRLTWLDDTQPGLRTAISREIDKLIGKSPNIYTDPGLLMEIIPVLRMIKSEILEEVIGKGLVSCYDIVRDLPLIKFPYSFKFTLVPLGEERPEDYHKIYNAHMFLIDFDVEGDTKYLLELNLINDCFIYATERPDVADHIDFSHFSGIFEKYNLENPEKYWKKLNFH